MSLWHIGLRYSWQTRNWWANLHRSGQKTSWHCFASVVSLCIWVLDIQCVWSQKEGANWLVCCVCMCLCPSFTWVALHLKCCIGWINTAVSHQCDSFERNSHPKFVTTGQQGAVERTLQCKNLLGNLFSTRPKHTQTVCLPIWGFPKHAMPDDPDISRCSRSGHEALKVQRGVFAPEAMISLSQW